MSKRDFKFKKEEWLRFIKNSPVTYRLSALRAAYENDGQEMLQSLLQELGWERSMDLLKSEEARGYLHG